MRDRAAIASRSQISSRSSDSPGQNATCQNLDLSRTFGQNAQVNLRSLAWTLVAALSATPAFAEPEALSGARDAYTAQDYEACQQNATRALKLPADRPGRVETWQLLGLCQAALNKTDEARESFRNMLSIDPEARLPEGLSPRFTSSFREAQGALVGGKTLALEVESDTVDGGTRVLRLHLTDTLELAKDIAWRGEGGVLSPAVRAAERVELEVPANVQITLVVRDRGGGEIVLHAIGKPGGEPAPTATPADEEAQIDPMPFIIGGGIALGVLVVGGALVAVLALSTPPDSVTLKTDVGFQK
jgi:hypothetical protein